MSLPSAPPRAVVAERMGSGKIESLRYPRNPLDVLAQQTVAAVAEELAALETGATLIEQLMARRGA